MIYSRRVAPPQGACPEDGSEAIPLVRPAPFCRIFGIDDIIVGALGAGAQVTNNQMTNQTNLAIAQAANAFNAQQAGINRDFSASQAQLARNFTGMEADIDRAYNHQAAEDSRLFNASEAEKSRQFLGEQSTLSRDFNSAEAAASRAFNASEAEKARDYTTMMSNSAYQRQVADMKAAGINPILAAYKGGGADVPGGSAASGSAASSGSPGTATGSAGAASHATGSGAMASGVSTPAAAIAHMRPIFENVFSTAKELARMDPEVRGLKQDVSNKEADEDRIEAQTSREKSAAAVNQATARNVNQDTALKRAQTENEGRRQSQVQVLGTGVNPAYWTDRAGQMFEKATNSAKSWWDMITGNSSQN